MISSNGNQETVLILSQVLTLTCNVRKIHVNVLILLLHKYEHKTEGT